MRGGAVGILISEANKPFQVFSLSAKCLDILTSPPPECHHYIKELPHTFLIEISRLHLPVPYESAVDECYEFCFGTTSVKTLHCYLHVS